MPVVKCLNLYTSQRKKLLPIRYTWEEKNVTFLAPVQTWGEKILICTRKKDKKKDWAGSVAQWYRPSLTFLRHWVFNPQHQKPKTKPLLAFWTIQTQTLSPLQSERWRTAARPSRHISEFRASQGYYTVRPSLTNHRTNSVSLRLRDRCSSGKQTEGIQSSNDSVIYAGHS